MSKLLLDQLAATNMVYSRFSFQYFLDSMQRLGVRNIEVYGCTTHFHFYDGGDPIPRLKKQIISKFSASRREATWFSQSTQMR